MLKVDGIEVYYGRIKALHGVSLEVPQGSIVTVLGANGAGKTTTVRTISGLLHPSVGTVTFLGQRIDRATPERIVAMGIAQVAEGRQIFPELTVLENLRMGAYVRKDRQVNSDLDRMYGYFPILKERRSQVGGTLSGGEQQMLAIARALMARPKLLLMDEPSLGLAPVIVRQIFDIVRMLNQEGTTILMVEQNANMALAVADYGYVLQTGRIGIHGLSKALRENEEVRRLYLGQTH